MAKTILRLTAILIILGPATVFAQAANDFNGDNNSDILWRNSVTGQNWLYLMNGASISSSIAVNTVSNLQWEIVGNGDYNNDGNADILWRNNSTGQNWMYLMNGASISGSVAVNKVSDLNWRVVGNGDYNGDGSADILWRNSVSGQNWMYLMNGASISSSVSVNKVSNLHWEIVGNGDYNNDGNADILWRNSVTGQNWMYLMNGATISSSLEVNALSDLNWVVVGNGDYDNDGNADILWRNSATGQNLMYLMNGATIVSSTIINTVSDSNWRIISSGDYNGDGNADILWRNLSTGQNWMYLMSGATITSSVGVNSVPTGDWFAWGNDIHPPDTKVTSSPADPTNSIIGVFEFSSTEAGSTFSCSLDGGALADCASPANFPGLSEGIHTLSVVATDAAGNTDVSPATFEWEIDITPPVCSVDSGPLDPTNITDASFTFSCSEPVTSECALDSENGGAFSACTSPKDYTGVAEGDRTFTMKATDLAGNTELSPPTYEWLVDITAPDPTSIVINNTATYAVSVSELTARIIAQDDIGVTDYLITEHNSTDPLDVVPPYLDPLPGDGRWVSTSSTTILDTTLQFALTGSYKVGDTVDLCVWFMDAASNISTQTCDSIIYGVDWESGLGFWSADNGLWQVGTPTVAGPSSCFSGTDCAGTVLSGNYPTITDSRLISPNFQLPTVTGSDELQLRFRHWFSYAADDDHGQVQISVWDPVSSAWGDWVDEGTAITVTSGGWSLKGVDLTAYSGERVRIGFMHASGSFNVSSGWYIDDVTIVKASPPTFTGDFESGWDDWGADNGVWQVGTPAGGPAGCFTGTQCAGTVLDGNYPVHTDSRMVGASMQLPTVSGANEVWLRFRHWFSYAADDDHGQVQISVWDSVSSTWGTWVDEGTAITVTSGGWSLKGVDLTAYSGERVRIGFMHASGAFTASSGWYIDDVNIVEVSPPAFTGDFEFGWDDWGADNGVWQVGTPAGGPAGCFTGTQCAGTVLDGNYPVHTDSRMVGASMQLPTVSGVNEIWLRFRHWFSYAADDDHGQVQISVWDSVSSTWGTWVDEGTAITITSGGWSLKGVDLTAYSGERVRIGFRHASGAFTASSGWYIDDVTVVEVSPPAFTGDFESGWDDWGADNGVWQVGTPAGGPAGCFTGTQCAGTVLDGNYPVHTDSRLVGASMQLPTVSGVNEIWLRFRHWFSYAADDDHGQVQISVWDSVSSTWGTWVDEGTAITVTSGGWSLKGVDLTAYSGERVRIGFLHASGAFNVGSGWYIDDVTVVEVSPPMLTCDFETGWVDWGADNGVWQVGTPAGGPASCSTGTQCAGTVLDGNYPVHTDSRLVSASTQMPIVTGFDEIHLRFQHWHAYSADDDQGQVQISVWNPVSSTWGAWVSEGAAVTIASGVWTLKDVTLTAYSGERVRIGFLHASGAFNVGSGWYVDDCSITVF